DVLFCLNKGKVFCLRGGFAFHSGSPELKGVKMNSYSTSKALNRKFSTEEVRREIIGNLYEETVFVGFCPESNLICPICDCSVGDGGRFSWTGNGAITGTPGASTIYHI